MEESHTSEAKVHLRDIVSFEVHPITGLMAQRGRRNIAILFLYPQR
jgi:hypothetical protein